MQYIMKNQLQPIHVFYVPYYLVIPKVVATSLAHAAARMTKAKFVLQTMMLRNLALKAFFSRKKKNMGVRRCEVLIP